MTVLSLSLLLLVGGTAPAASSAAVLSPAAAYALLQKEGRLENVTIVGALDLTRLRPPSKEAAIELLDVIVRGSMIASALPLTSPLHVRGGSIEAIHLDKLRLAAEIVLDAVKVAGVTEFDGAMFGGAVRIYQSTFLGSVSFRSVHFQGPVEIVGTEFKKPKAGEGNVSFKDAVFKEPARFDNSHSEPDLWFDSAVFEGDASFLKLQVDATAYFRGTQFMRDAEFRFCRFGRGSFGNYEFMSAFHGLADFRGCTMGTAAFEYTEFLGNVAFVNATIEGDLSLRNAALRGATADLSGLRVKDRLLLDDACFAKMLFRWNELSGPILAATPKASTLAFLEAHLETAGDKADANDLAYRLARARLGEQLARAEWPDTLGPRFEQLLWGLPTGYGTKLGRIAIVVSAAWVLVSLWLLVLSSLGKLTFEWVARPEPHTLAQLATPMACPAPVWVVLRYASALMLKLPFRDVRPLASSWVRGALWATRCLGLLLMALLALTLANVSPAVQAVIGKVAL